MFPQRMRNYYNQLAPPIWSLISVRMRNYMLPLFGELIAHKMDQYTTKFCKIGIINQKLVDFQFELCVTTCQGFYKNKPAKCI